MNKIIWTYWHQGFEQAPLLVQTCIKRWQILHPDWEINLLDRKSVDQFIEPIPIAVDKKERMSIPHCSDLVRTRLLIKYGGVWADPTCFPMVSLEDWLPEYMKSGLFLFSNPGRDRIISNWFIAAEPQNPFLKKLYDSLCAFWNQNEFRNLGRKNKSKLERQLNRFFGRNIDLPRLWFSPIMTKLVRLYPYMVYHYKFYDLIKTNPECCAIWEKTQKFSADIPHKLQRFGLLASLTPESKRWIDQKKAPLFKLTWKLPVEDYPADSTIFYLFNKNV